MAQAYLRAPLAHTGVRFTDPQPPVLTAAALQGNGDIQLAFNLGAAFLGHDSILVLRRLVGETSWVVHASGQSTASPYTVLVASITLFVVYEWALAGVKGAKVSGVSNVIPKASMPSAPTIAVTLPTQYDDLGALIPGEVTNVNVYYGLTQGDYTELIEFGDIGGQVPVVTSGDPQTWYFAVEILTDDGAGAIGQSHWSDPVSLSLTGGGTVNVDVIIV